MAIIPRHCICDTDSVAIELDSAGELPSREQCVEEFSTQLERTVERLRTMSIGALEREDKMAFAHDIIQLCADLARKDAQQSVIDVAHVKAATLADQLFVIGRDLLTYGSSNSLVTMSKTLLEFRRTL